jgi:hypothetical protein
MTPHDRTRLTASLMAVLDRVAAEVGEQKARELWRTTLKSRIGKRKRRTTEYDKFLNAMWVVYLKRERTPGRNELYRSAAKVFLETTGGTVEASSVERHLKEKWPDFQDRRQLEWSQAIARELLRPEGGGGILGVPYRPPAKGGD